MLTFSFSQPEYNRVGVEDVCVLLTNFQVILPTSTENHSTKAVLELAPKWDASIPISGTIHVSCGCGSGHNLRQ